jgi:aspartate kinase|uniref:Aspartokinase n=1 Tax=candidate division WOR-3 bacterium TaxID=2052148 RepID=A0A7C3YTP0_UNCW3
MVVLKFGGDTLSSTEKIKKVAKYIAKRRRKGEKLCVVVSAMGETTDRLLARAHSLNPSPPKRELDMLVTTGERISASLLAIALQREGIPAISFTGSQVGIITDLYHTDARIVQIKGFRLKESLAQGRVPIVCGFQGVSYKKEITTLGRGGSDITAVALAWFLKARICEFYKAFSGIFTENPKEFKNLKRLKELSYEEALELTSSGSEVLNPRALALANKYNIKILVRSLREGGTMIKSSLLSEGVEKAFVKALTHRFDLVRFTFLSVPKVSQCLSQVCGILAQKRIPFLFFFHGLPHNNRFDLSFILSEESADKAEDVFFSLKEKIRAENLEIRRGIGSISLVGPNVGTDPEVLAKVFSGLKKKRCHIEAFSSSATNLTVYLNKEDVGKGVKGLLKEFHLQR